jgi:hypothetical protein
MDTTVTTDTTDTTDAPQAPTEPTPPDEERSTWETLELEAEELVAEVKRIMEEGRARRIVVKQDGEPVIEIPLLVGVVGTVLAAPLAAVGALAALLTNCSIEVEREPEVAEVAEAPVAPTPVGAGTP